MMAQGSKVVEALKVQDVEGSLRGEILRFEAQHRVAELVTEGCDNTLGLHGSEDLVKQKTVMKRQVSLVMPVKVWAPSGHRSEEGVVSEENVPTSREWPDESVDSGSRRSREMPTTSRSADLGDLGLTIYDKTLDYEDDQEIEEGEICDNGEQTMGKAILQVKGGRGNKERSFGVLQDSTIRTVKRNHRDKKDIRLMLVDRFRKLRTKVEQMGAWRR
ncbi:hypothetical protein NDU88_006251 [Pleurodeles waltl]|uniref:Uncharacterized protein n=1 Tax=Pleurodeles waltl TaxID=8319 RepID=A0AAV7RLC5_PLEWA|nr:hypothetical protein NDU88_006251 [Pleurodeles waltl]